MHEQLIKTYKRHHRKGQLFMLVSVLCLLVTIIISALLGAADINAEDLSRLYDGTADPAVYQVLFKIRLPRIVGALLAGLALSVSGAAIQSLLRNPLASPFTLGISGASAFGAAFAIIIFGAGTAYNGSDDAFTLDSPYLVSASAFAWSLASVAVILLLSRYKGATPEVIILSGIIISSLFGAGISAMQYVADSVQLASIVFWTFGDLGRATWHDTGIQAIIVVPATLYFLRQSWNYKSLQAGDEYAISVGVNPQRTRLAGMVLASLVTAVVVAFYGVIAFVGLVVPHIVRRIIGGDELFLLPGSAIFGALFLLLSDTAARTVISPVIVPVGILTSFIGAPLFLFLLIKGMNKTYWQ